jgi:hypothetical protein
VIRCFDNPNFPNPNIDSQHWKHFLSLFSRTTLTATLFLLEFSLTRKSLPQSCNKNLFSFLDCFLCYAWLWEKYAAEISKGTLRAAAGKRKKK